MLNANGVKLCAMLSVAHTLTHTNTLTKKKKAEQQQTKYVYVCLLKSRW